MINQFQGNSFILCVCVLAAVLLQSCVTTGSAKTPHVQIIPLKNNDKAGLEADDIVSVMKMSNFSDEEIIKHALSLRNCLAINGAANIKVGDFTEMICYVQYPNLMVSTRLHGSFVYNIETNEYR